MNQQATAVVLEIQRAATLAQQQAANINGLVGKFDVITHQLGNTFLDAHFVDADGQPRTDLGGIVKADIEAVIDGLRAIQPIINAHMAAFIKAGI